MNTEIRFRIRSEEGNRSSLGFQRVAFTKEINYA